LLVLFGADGLIEGGGAGEIADRQIDEDQFGHGGSFRVVRSKDERADAIPTPDLDFFDDQISFKTPRFVMAGLVPAIHVLLCGVQNVDAWDKPGHDGSTNIALDITSQSASAW
jgi:hypothetical protein